MSMDRVIRSIRQNELLYTAVRTVRDNYVYAKGYRRGSFSQHGEDTFFYQRFGQKNDGFYVDVGANHPFKLSNTFLLYKRGWRGVTVEPIPLMARLHKRWRPQDNLVQKAIGTADGTLHFQEMIPSVLSTLDLKTAEEYVAGGHAQLLRSFPIEVITLDKLFADYVGKRPVDLLSIDVEGLDSAALTAFKLDRFRPNTICIEANHSADRAKILAYFEQRNYQLIAELGVNLIAEDASR